ncbi:precorrin-2 dehydrogenase/sirohydrochlorin ferrochelatase family protein [Halonotius roseus]|uniref:precorrin-2 dehydrogenase n=1 Tax=Halonotius roseus TaxID=2511997 RepID=A0A544QM32_9EURY|nr:bifunctional precorrin-2 dehydrogenase/sirohydrochlorin ferrochelatase [Halonotius roseus]TQQ79648.1 bifunctional precorrin-2 dehydrogenase/sirohydrochlorin ferrochelatase [Halonotius roseus]
MIPLYHDFTDATVLVFGGGSVGARKAERFAAEADVVVVSPTFDDRFEKPEFPTVERVRAAPTPATVDDWLDRVAPALVVAATDDSDLNATVAEAAADRDVLVNRTDRAGDRSVGSVVVPATIEDDPVSVAISTGGQSPALARYLREQVEREISNAGKMAELTGRLRAELKETEPPETRRAMLRAVVRSPAVWKALHTGIANAEKEAARVMQDHRTGEDT